MTSSVSSSASDWPPKMTKPIAWLVPEPMPRETISGIMPATNANVVIRIGRSRSRLARTIASCVRHAGLLQLVGVVDLQNRVLLHDAEQHQQAERREDVQRLPEDDDRQQRERQRQRQRQQNRDRVQPRFELRRQDQIHEDQRQHEREHEVLRRAPELARAAGEAAAILAAGVEPVELGQHRVLHRRLRRRRQQVAEHRHLPLPRQAVDVGRRRARREVGDVLERDAAQPRRRHRQRRDRRLRSSGSRRCARRCTSYCSPPSL